MGSKGKTADPGTLCKWKPGQYAKQRELLARITAEPVHFCYDCGRVANKKKWLCKPERLVGED